MAPIETCRQCDLKLDNLRYTNDLGEPFCSIECREQYYVDCVEELKRKYKLTTSWVFPPIPIRTCDWVAYRDAEDRRQGWGSTEAGAIQDWIDNYSEEE